MIFWMSPRLGTKCYTEEKQPLGGCFFETILLSSMVWKVTSDKHSMKSYISQECFKWSYLALKVNDITFAGVLKWREYVYIYTLLCPIF